MTWLRRAYCRVFHHDHRHPCRAWWDCRFSHAARAEHAAQESCGNADVHTPHPWAAQLGDPESASRTCESRWCVGVSNESESGEGH